MSSVTLALAKAILVVWCCCLLVALCAHSVRNALPLAAAATLTPDDAQRWRALSNTFDWQQSDATAHVAIAGRGVQDADGHFYFVGTKTYASATGDGDQNIFIARINADDTLAWTKELGTDESDAGRSLTLVNETTQALDGSTTTTESLYVVGTTWGLMDDGAHALNGFGHFGGRDVVLLKLTLAGDKVWSRQFGSSGNDFSYGVTADTSFESLLLSGGCIVEPTTTVVEVPVDDVLEARAPFARYETQIMDPRARSSVRAPQYAFAASFSFSGDLLDFTMDGGVTLTPRRQRVEEGGSVAGEYAVVLNHRPLNNVTVRAAVEQLVDPADSSAYIQQLALVSSDTVNSGSSAVLELVFTPSNWNREQLVRVMAIDDARAEGVHFASVVHTSTSRDPNFDGLSTPFAYGASITMQIADNDVAGVQLSRSHVFAAEGGRDDAYDVVLMSQPWHAVTVSIVPLHSSQTRVTPSELLFAPTTWQTPQRVVVAAVDDAVSENEYSGLHAGGALLHYSASRDMRYHTRRPLCYDVVNCDATDTSDCIDMAAVATEHVRVCDLATNCAFTLGNGACVANIVMVTSVDAVPARFGAGPLDPSQRDSVDATLAPALTRDEVRAVLTAQATDATAACDAAESDPVAFIPPPRELEGFVLSFLGLVRLEQAELLARSPRRVLHAACAGLSRLETHRWSFGAWPSGYVGRVLDAVRAMFPDTLGVDDRRLSNCGVSHFRGGSGVAVTIWDNDPGVTLSTASLTVRESSSDNNDDDAAATATYSIVLNAPPIVSGSSFVQSTTVSMCKRLESDECGLWSSDDDSFAALAARMYSLRDGSTTAPATNVSIAIVANAHVSVTPSLVTFTTTNWFIPQVVTVRAVDNDVAESDGDYTLAHRVQDAAATTGYSNATAFWVAQTLPRLPLTAVSDETPADDRVRGVLYNPIPTLLFAPAHQLVNVHVVDNDRAGVDIIVDAPNERVASKETADPIDWVGDYATAYAFSDVSVQTTSPTTTLNYLVLGPNATTFLKFHVPRTHDGDMRTTFRSATLRLFETPFKVFNVTDTVEAGTLSSSSTASTSDTTVFTKVYRVRISVVQNDWTRASVRTLTAPPKTFAVAAVQSIDVTATVDRSRSIELDVTALIAQLLPMRVSVASLRIDVLNDDVNTTTQICSSLFERKLRPTMQFAYTISDVLRLHSVGAVTTQSSTSVGTSAGAMLAVDGDHSTVSATQHTREPWWQSCLNTTVQIGQVALVVPASMVGAPLVAIATLEPLDATVTILTDALVAGCPTACPQLHRVTVLGTGVLLWDVMAGLRCLRVYRNDTGVLELAGIEAYEPTVRVTPNADGTGLRARLKTDWTAQRASESWRIQQTARQIDAAANLALGMATRQSSTSAERAFAYLAVDGQVEAAWDATVVQPTDTSATTESTLLRPGSTRTQLEVDPWWEVDLGSIKPIRAVVLFPFVGMASRGFCAPISENTVSSRTSSIFPSWTGDLYTYSRTDPLLLLPDPFVQDFDVLITDESLATAADPLNVVVTARRTLTFSCLNATLSIAWPDAFTRGRFVTVRKQGLGVLMLNEVHVLRWNPSTTPRYMLLDLYGTGTQRLALAGVQLFAPTDVTVRTSTSSGTNVAAPIAFSVHSASSQAARTGAGSAAALVIGGTGCYVAATATAHEWLVLDLGHSTPVGLIEFDTSVAACGTNVSAVRAVSVAAYGASLDGVRSVRATNALTVALGTCALDATSAVRLPPGATNTTGCSAFVCAEAACSSHVRAVGTTSTLVLSDFSDVVLLGVPDLAPLARLPLSIREHRAVVLRDNPVALWTFDDVGIVPVWPNTNTIYDRGTVSSQPYQHRATGAFRLTTTAMTKQLVVATTKEETHMSNAVLFQPAMPAFTLEFWVNYAAVTDSSNTMNIVTVDANGTAVATLARTPTNPAGVFTLTDTATGKHCVVAIDGDAAVEASDVWVHYVASYDPATAAIALWLSYTLPGASTSARMTQRRAKTTCSLALLNGSPKLLSFGAYTPPVSSSPTLSTPTVPGFTGRIASVAWYQRALGRAEILDHYHDFRVGHSDAATPTHAAYALQLTSKPLAPVHIAVRADTQCYRFNTCNASVVPTTVTIRPEMWREPAYVRVVVTSDQLYEGAHTTTLTHEVSGEPSYVRTTTAMTLNVTASVDTVKNDNTVLSTYEALVRAYYDDLQVTRVLLDANAQRVREDALLALQRDWSAQRTTTSIAVNDPYSSVAVALSVAAVTVFITDATVPGIEFSASALVVSESGKANDYQVVLLSEPTSIVTISMSVEHDCYRACIEPPASRLCPSQTVASNSSQASTLSTVSAFACGDASTPTKLCNVTVTPTMLVFSAANWSRAQTVRVVAVDDELDESDVHLTTIRSVTTSLDVVYNNTFLPDIVVAIEDNDNTDVVYSTLSVALGETPGLLHNYATTGGYTLRLATEPWANVTVAMSNEANGACYRACGYPHDAADCGLPRQQSVTTVELRTNATREIQRIALAIPKVVAVQRVVTYVEHVDQIVQLDVTGGFTDDVQVVAFAVSPDVFKQRFGSESAVATAATGTYGRTFRFGATDRGDLSPSADGFASAVAVKAVLDALFGVPDAVRVTRTVVVDKAMLQWRITFLRLVSADARFPALTIALDAAFEGAVTAARLNVSMAPTGRFTLRYGATTNSSSSVIDVPVFTPAAILESALRDLDAVYSVSVSRALHARAYGYTYLITFKSVEAFEPLVVVNTSGIIVASPNISASVAAVVVNETQAPVRITGAFTLEFVRSLNTSSSKTSTNTTATTTNTVTRTPALPWNASAEVVAAALSRLNGLANVAITRRALSPEGAMEWTVEFRGTNGPLRPLVATSVNLTGVSNRNRSVTLAVMTVRTGEALGGTFVVEMGGRYKQLNATTQSVDTVDIAKRNTSALPFNVSSSELEQALLALGVTERTAVTRVPIDCDTFSVCNGYTWTISYHNSAGDVPPIRVYSRGLTGTGATLTSSTVANGTYITGVFTLTLALWDSATQSELTATTWDLPVDVSAIGMDEALEAIAFVRSNREAELDVETCRWRGIAFDKGVRVTRTGPYLDGGHTWRLAWAIEDYKRFQDLRVSIDASRVLQETESLRVPTEFDLLGVPRCSAIPTARFAPDPTDPFGLRGACVYDVVNVTVQERFLCNYTVANPWLVFTPANWCIPQRVNLVAVDDAIDEQTQASGNVTFSNVTHSVVSDDVLYVRHRLPNVVVAVESDDVAQVLVSTQSLEVSEDGARVGTYELQLTTEPLDDVTIVVLPWLDSVQTGCYRFGLCNVTLPTTAFVFTPRNWYVPQTVVAHATDDDLDEADTHATGISHVAYSTDAKYDKIAIPTIDVTVFDNDNSGFFVLQRTVVVAEGGAFDTYDVVLGSEPFAKVLVTITNIGAVGSLAVPTPSTLLFTWSDWNVSQHVRVDALDDATEDPRNSSSKLVHTLTTNDAIYAALPNLPSVTVVITDNDVSGLALSTQVVYAAESNNTVFTYSVRLTSEPWEPVVVRPNASHGCYKRVLSAETICNVTMISSALYFGASNWSVAQPVAFRAVDDWLVEAPVHDARITHATTSRDLLYDVADYTSRNGSVTVRISDNDVAFVNISLAIVGGNSNSDSVGAPRTMLHVAEGGFNDTYRIVLNSEPYDDVLIRIQPRIDAIVDLTDKTVVRAAQVGVASGARASVASATTNGSLTRDVELVFTALDWSRPRVVTVFALDDRIAEDSTHFSAIGHTVASADALYNVSNSSLGVGSVPVMVNDKEALAPPVPVAAVFDATGAKIHVTFDSSVFHAETMSIRFSTISPPSSTSSISAATTVLPTTTSSAVALYTIRLKQFACELVFSLAAARYALGRGAQCLWLDFRTLRIDLGASATVTVNDTLVLNDCTVFVNQTCQSTTVVRARHTSRAYAQASVAVRVPSDIVTPHVVLMAPDEASSCGAWRVDATLSQGSGGRAFVQATWFVLPSSVLTAGDADASAVAIASADAVRAQTQTMYAALAPLCVKYKTDWMTGKSVSIFVPKADLTANPDLADALSTMDTLRAACYVRSIAQTATTTQSLVLELDSALLELGVTYVVGLELTNAFAQRSAIAKTIAVRTRSGPMVYVVGDQHVDITRVGDPLALTVDAAVACTDEIGTLVGFSWTVMRAPTGSAKYASVDLSRANVAKDPRVFRVVRAALDVDTTYRFRAEAYMRNNSDAVNSSTTITVQVVPSALTAKVTGGMRAVGIRDTLVLNGSMSNDPDDSAAPFTFAWRCVDVTSTSVSMQQPCRNATTTTVSTSVAPPTAVLNLVDVTGAALSLPPYVLEPNRTLTFTLTVSKPVSSTNTQGALRTATTTTTVWTLDGSVPDVAVVASAAKISASSRVALTAQVKSSYPYTTQWVQTRGDLDLPDAYDATASTTHDAFALPLTSLNNVVLKDKLTPGVTYVLRLVAASSTGRIGFGDVTIQVNAPPSVGRFSVTPTTGVAVYDTFTLMCLEWTDDVDDLPLTYAFSMLATTAFDALVDAFATAANRSALGAALQAQATPLVPQQLVPTAVVTMLPPAGLRATENVTLVAFITDAFGAVAFAAQRITVTLPSSAKSDPIAFANSLMAVDSSATRAKRLLSAALVLDGTFNNDAISSCTGADATPLSTHCSGHGTCDTASHLCVCTSSYMGIDCAFDVAAVRTLNTAILSQLFVASSTVEASSSELAQQALVMNTVLQATPTAFNADGRAQVAALSRNIVGNAFGLSDPRAFLDAAGATVLNALSTVVGLAADSVATPGRSGRSTSQNRRLATQRFGVESTALDCSSDAPETAQTQAAFADTVETLHALAALASEDALPEEAAVAIASTQIRTLATAGTQFTALHTTGSDSSTDSLSVKLTEPAIACLDPGLFLSAFVLAKPPHSLCSLGGAVQLSASTVVAVHSKAALASARASVNNSRVSVQTLTSASRCVAQAAAKLRAKTGSVSRLTESELESDAETKSGSDSETDTSTPMSRRLASTSTSVTVWQPLVVLSIPHTRPLTALEQHNFTTACHVWDAVNSTWTPDVCFQDPTASSATATVCYCSELGALEVLVTLDERLDYYTVETDLYRDDAMSIVPAVIAVALVAVVVLGSCIGQRVDAHDAQQRKTKTIQGLNRAKWRELTQRTTSSVALEDFAAFCARTTHEADAKKAKTTRLTVEQSGVSGTTTAASTVSLGSVTDSVHDSVGTSPRSVQIAAALVPGSTVDAALVLPHESRTLFGTSVRVDKQYRRICFALRSVSAVLVVLGAIVAFVGLDVYFVLGHSTTELLLFVYGQTLGLVLLACGAVLIGAGAVGVRLAHRDATHVARTTFATVLTLLLASQLVLVAAASHYVDDLSAIPTALNAMLEQQWRALDDSVIDDIERYYGCCGFGSIANRIGHACPEEALDAVPPRTCMRVLQREAQVFFTHALTYVQVLLAVEAIAVLLATGLVKWRYLRLEQLAASATESLSTMLATSTTVGLLCVLPSLIYVLSGAMAAALALGIDLVTQLNVASDAVVSALYGRELGAAVIAVSSAYLVVLLRGAHALAVRNVRALQLFVVLSATLLLLMFGVAYSVASIATNVERDPNVLAAAASRFRALPRSTRVTLELALQCCGVDDVTDGTCLLSTHDNGAAGQSLQQSTIQTCRSVIAHALAGSLAVLSTRLTVLVSAHAVVLVLSTTLLLRLWRFRLPTRVHSTTPAATTAVSDVDAYDSTFDKTVRFVSTAVLVLLSVFAAVLGLVVLCAGLDVMYELNVLHVSYLVQTLDRHVGAHLVVVGSALVLFGAGGAATAYTRSHRVFAVYATLGLALFAVGFSALGVAYSYAYTPQSSTNDDILRFRLQELWRAAPSSTKMFVQNAFTCCGFDRIELTNGSVTFTDRADALFWTPVTEYTTVYTQSSNATTNSSSETATQQHVLAATQTRTFTQAVCPTTATVGCADIMIQYVTTVAQSTVTLCIVQLSALTAVLLSASVVVVRRGAKPQWQPTLRLLLARTGVLLLSTTMLFAALTAFVLALDMVAGWSLLSANLLQLLFAKSLGLALLVYAAVALILNVVAITSATYYSVHMLFIQSVVRCVSTTTLWVIAGAAGYLSRYSADADWQQTLVAILDRRWTLLAPYTQHAIALEYACCGFHDPVVIKGHGVVFDRSARGYTCPLANIRGCEHVLLEQLSASFAWLFVFTLALAVAETVLLALGAALLQQLARVYVREWFAIASRVRYAVGKYRSEARRRHVMLSLVYTYDAKYTRTQRLVTLLSGLLTSLAVLTRVFATRGCHRRALLTCVQPDGWNVVGMALLYGAAVGYGTQCVSRYVFELVRHRSDDETTEVAAARQRKEKVLLFRSLFQRRRPGPATLSAQSPGLAGSSPSTSQVLSTIDTAHATTEERWSTWLNRFVYRVYHTVAAALFVFASGVATLMALVLVGYGDTVNGVTIDSGPFELLVFALLVGAMALLAWFAVDMKDRKQRGSLVVFVAVAVTSVLLLAGALAAVYMVVQVLDDDSTADANWTVRKTGFSVVERLERVWTTEPSTYYRNRMQLELQCCGFRDATDHALRPCPTGTTVDVAYEALSVNGSAVAKVQTEVRDLDGCLDKLLVPFERIANTVATAAIALCAALFVLFVSAVYMAYDVHTSKDAKLKLRVREPSTSTAERKPTSDVRQMFANVVGLKIAAPARGTILSKMLATSLDSVGQTLATELAVASIDGRQAARDAPSEAKLLTRQSINNDVAALTDDNAIASVPYPAAIVYVPFAICSVWIAGMLVLIVMNASALGSTTAIVCIVCWAIGVSVHLLAIEPSVLFGSIVISTLGAWWHNTWLGRLVLYGRDALRIAPDAATAAARYYASLSLYERIRLNAAVRIQRRLLTRVTRLRYLAALRTQRANAHRSLAEHRRATLKRAIEGFTDDEVRAFRVVFDAADVAKLGLVPYTVISESIYQLGVRVTPERVHAFLHALDPAYADLVDLDHFLYGMHCVRMHHQQEQAGGATDTGVQLTEEFVSASMRFGPSADPQATVLVTRQNVLRELKATRASLSYKLLGKLSKQLPPLLQRGKTGALTARLPSSAVTGAITDVDAATRAGQPARSASDSLPTGAFVILQNRKLTPKKRALEMVLKKKHRDDRTKATIDERESGAAGSTSPVKSPVKSSVKPPAKSPAKSPSQRAKAMVQSWTTASPSGKASKAEQELAVHQAAAATATVVTQETSEARDDGSSDVANSDVHASEVARVDSYDRLDLDSVATSAIPMQVAIEVNIKPSEPDVLTATLVPTAPNDDNDVRVDATRTDAAAVAGDSVSNMVAVVDTPTSVDAKANDVQTAEQAVATPTRLYEDSPANLTSARSSDDNDKSDSVQTTGSDETRTADVTLSAQSSAGVSEPKPTGTFKRLNKQTSSSVGKNKILENILQKKAQTESKSNTATGSNHAASTSVAGADGKESKSAAKPASKPPLVPAAAATSSLEKALKKKSKGNK